MNLARKLAMQEIGSILGGKNLDKPLQYAVTHCLVAPDDGVVGTVTQKDGGIHLSSVLQHDCQHGQ